MAIFMAMIVRFMSLFGFLLMLVLLPAAAEGKHADPGAIPDAGAHSNDDVVHSLPG
jgi:hypothetical protein